MSKKPSNFVLYALCLLILFLLFSSTVLSVSVNTYALFKTGNDILSIGELLKDVKTAFTADDLYLLKITDLYANSGAFSIRSYLLFYDANSYVAYSVDSDDQVGDYLIFPNSTSVFQFRFESPGGVISVIDANGNLTDLKDKILFILGENFTIFDARRLSGNGISLTLLGGAINDTLTEGETGLYSIGGSFFEVSLLSVNETNQTALFSVNNVILNELKNGELDAFNGTKQLAVKKVHANQTDKRVEFYLDAKKIEMQDADYTDTAFAEGTVLVNGETIDDVQLAIWALNQSSNTELAIGFVKYDVSTDDDYYVPQGKGIKEFFSQKEAFLTDDWDIAYQGLFNTGTSVLRLIPISNHSYNLSFENINGDNYTFPFVTNKSDSDIGFKYGDSLHDLIFTEPYTASQMEDYYNWTFISINDSFIVSTAAFSDNNTVTNIMRYIAINTDDKTAQFTDLSQGNIIVSYTGTPGINASGELVVSGASHTFWIGNETMEYAISMDLNADGSLAEAKVNPVIRGGGILDLGTQLFDFQNLILSPLPIESSVDMTLTTLRQYFDESIDNETINISILGNGANSLYSTIDTVLVGDPSNPDYSGTLTPYGVFIERYAPSDNQTGPNLTINYPLAQRYAQVFINSSFNNSENHAPNITILDNITINETALADVMSYFTVNDDSSGLVYSFSLPINASGMWKTTFNDSGEYNSVITVSDGQLSSSKAIHITVLDLPDIDGDGNPDYNDTDDDNDGINDTVDRVLGNASYVNSDTLSAINVTVNGSDNLSKLFNDTFNVTLGNGSNVLVEFSYNFTESILPLYNISIDVQNDTVAGSLLIKGLVLQGNFTKAVYVDRVSSSINSVCIKDAPISIISEISSLCNGANETPLACPGLSSSYNCSLANNNQSFKITGLRYSGVRQQTYCGDGTCNGDETCSLCQSDCGTCPSGHSSGGGGIIDTEKDWICLNWSLCVNGKQTQNCTHKTRNTNKTNIRSCNVTITEESIQNNSEFNGTNTSDLNITENTFNNNQTNQSDNETFEKEESFESKNSRGIKPYLLIAGGILILIILVLLFFRTKNKNFKTL